MGQGQGGSDRQVSVDPLAIAVEGSPHVTGLQSGWRQTLSGSTDLSVCGCALAWCLANGRLVSQVHDTAGHLGSLFESGMRHRAGRSRSAFPLCEGEFEEALRFLRGVSFAEASTEAVASKWSSKAWTMLACFACQVLDSGYTPFLPGTWSKREKRLACAVEHSVQRLQSHGPVAAVDLADVEKGLLSSRVSYEGEEIGVCHKLSYSQVLPALPPIGHGGSIEVCNFVGGTTKYWLERPEMLLVEDTGQALPKLQGRIHVEQGEIGKISQELVNRGVCCWIPYENVVEFRGQKVLNGLFGVAKSGSVEGGRCILRLIMNLVPSNSILKQFKGSTKRLPHITSWLSTFVDQGEELRIWQSDMSNAFYLFRLPQQWQPYLSFNVVRRKCEVMDGNDTSLVALACTVLPMGWGSSVAIMQELSENILKAGAMPLEGQIVRGQGLPLWMVGLVGEATRTGKSWWHVYLDNFAAAEVGTTGSDFAEGHKLHEEAEHLWDTVGVVSAQKKRRCGELTAQELGAHLDGQSRSMGPSLERMIRLVQATVVLLLRKSLSKKLVQIIAGRWVHAFQSRRPAMSLLEVTWEFVSSTGMRLDLQQKVKRELFACMCAMPFLHTFLGAQISPWLSASDASHVGGAVGIARCLTPAGEDFVRSALNPSPLLNSGIMVISLFHGIGGSFRAYDILGVKPSVLIAFEIHKPAVRVTSRRWPHAEMFGDVKTLDKQLMDDLLRRHPEILEVHLWGGFPCVDLSSVNAMGRGLAGPQSSLFFEFTRILEVLRKTCPSHIKVKFTAENVASMPKTECQKISGELGVWPYHLNCVDAVPMQRPRLCWTSERLEGCLHSLSFKLCDFWTEVTATAPYPKMDDWIEAPFWWYGGDQDFSLPTALKSIERKRPPPVPAGYNRCDDNTLARWTIDAFRFPPYHYMERFLFWSENTWRLANSSEKELLLGYGFGHTKLCFSASKIKESKVKYEDERLSLLGDSFSVYSFVIAAAALCRHKIPEMPYSQLANRMGLAPGFTCSIRAQAPIKRVLQYGALHVGTEVVLKNLNQILLSKTNHTGSDVRVSTGEFLNPKAVVRQSIEAEWCHWEHLFNFRWKLQEHSNVLELRTILHAIQFYVSHLGVSHQRVFHVTDSYICMSVLAKGRTGSKQLGRVLKKINALLLAFGIYCVTARVESSENPTDEASRKMAVLSS